MIVRVQESVPSLPYHRPPDLLAQYIKQFVTNRRKQSCSRIHSRMATVNRCYLLLLIVMSISFSICNGQLVGIERLSQERKSQQSWSSLIDLVSREDTEDDFKKHIGVLLQDLKSSSFPTFELGANVSQQCREDSLFYVESLLFNRSNWALQMLESSAQFPAGIIGVGNYHAEGLFDECLAIHVTERYKGQYCTVFFKPEPIDQSKKVDEEPTSNSTILSIFRLLFGSSAGIIRVDPKTSKADSMTYVFPSIGLCIPSSCSASDLGESIAQMIGSYVIANQSIVTIADESYCHTDDSNKFKFDGPTIAVIVTMSLIGLVVLLATIHDSWRVYQGVEFVPKTDNKFMTVLHCFSALSNGRKLLSLNPASSGSDNLSCLHGIRFLSTCWVVLGHAWLKGATANIFNPKMVALEAMSWEMESIINATVSVDSFFMMSGLLISYLLLRELDKNAGKFNLGLLYIHRYFRLTPVYAIILGFIATLMVYLGTGPNWYNVVVASEGCRITWWKQFLYINNFFPTDMNTQCMGETWYLAVDMQLFLIAPFFIYTLWRWKKIGLLMLAFFMLASLAANVAVFVIYNFPPTLMPTRMNEMIRLVTSYMDKYYFKPWIRAPPYIVGIWTGWFLHRIKHSKLHLPKWVAGLLWTLSAVFGGLIIYGLTPYVDESVKPKIDLAVRLTYGPLHRAIWALALAWVIVACIHGYGGFVDHFLSWRGFLPLSRLTYCVYLIHYDYLNIYYSLNRRLIYYTFIDQLTAFFGVTVIVFGLAFVVSLFVEAPFINLERLIFSSEKTNKDSNSTNVDQVKSVEEERNVSDNMCGHSNPVFISGNDEQTTENQFNAKM